MSNALLRSLSHVRVRTQYVPHTTQRPVAADEVRRWAILYLNSQEDKVKRDLHLLVAWIVLLLIGLSLVAAVTLTVPVHADHGILYAAPTAQGTGDCSNWYNVCTLQDALTKANSGDEIWVKRGVHKPTTVSSDRTASFSLKNDVAIYGGFIGTETDRDQRDWKTNVTVLSGDIDGSDNITDTTGTVTTPSNIRGGNSYHVISNTNVISTAILDGFVITAGQADGMSPHNNGGGMHNMESSPTLRNITFSGNTATEDGGGMYNTNSSPVLTNVTFSNNTANRGGGMYHFGPSATWTNVTFSGNTASQDGGGMYNDRSSPTLNRATFRENTADQNGGGMYNYHLYSKPTLINAVFNRNLAGSGGGMYNYGSSPTLVNVTFGGNTAGSGGGMYNYSSLSTPVLTNVVLWNNSTEISNGVGANPTIAYSDIRDCGGSNNWDSSCGSNAGNNIDADPLFVNLVGGNLDLQPDSPCVDAGSNAALPANVTTDLDGKPRIVDGDGDSTAVVDMGAYEVQPSPPTPIPTTAPTTVPTSVPPAIPTTVITPPHVYLPAVRK